MIYFLKHFKGIAYFLVILILFQSCVVYKKSPSTIKEASFVRDTPVKIITKDGKDYILNWIEEKDDNVVSIKNTERIFINKSEITSIFKYDPEPIGIGTSLELALEHNGAVHIITEKNTYDFIKIEEQGDLVKGISKLDGDTLSIVIPRDKIGMIYLKDKGKSSARSTGLFVGIGFVVGTIIVFLVMSEGIMDGFN